MTGIIDIFGPHAATVAAVATKMMELDLTPADVLREYDAWMAARMADMVPASASDAPAAAPSDPDTRRTEGQADAEYRLGTCPRCGDAVWGIRKCPHITPPWRTFLACDNPDCVYHGRSRLSVDELRRTWPAGVEED